MEISVQLSLTEEKERIVSHEQIVMPHTSFGDPALLTNWVADVFHSYKQFVNISEFRSMLLQSNLQRYTNNMKNCR